jgi:hypothetical protein
MTQEYASKPRMITYNVNNDILVEGVAPFCGNIADVHHRLWVVTVDVEDGSVHDTSNVCKKIKFQN